MRYVRIFLLHFQYVFERRAVSVVWFLVGFINPLILLIYWRAALLTNTISGWTISGISTYYFLLVIAAALLMSHIEEHVSEEDIAQGQLVKYIIRPFSYFRINLIGELPYRILQGFLGIFICIIFIILYGRFFQISSNPIILFLTVIIFFLAYFLSFTFKMVLGLLAFWLTDANGFYQLLEVLIIIFAGYVLPLNLMPDGLYSIARCLPFAYIIYYPIIVLQGIASLSEIIQIVFMQVFWISIFAVIYKILWNKGIKEFTGVGQ